MHIDWLHRPCPVSHERNARVCVRTSALRTHDARSRGRTPYAVICMRNDGVGATTGGEARRRRRGGGRRGNSRRRRMHLCERKLYEFVHPARIAPKRTTLNYRLRGSCIFPGTTLRRSYSWLHRFANRRTFVCVRYTVRDRATGRSTGWLVGCSESRNDFNVARGPESFSIAVRTLTSPSDRDAKAYFYGAICRRCIPRTRTIRPNLIHNS